MTQNKHTKFIVFALIFILVSANQAVLASSMFHRHQDETPTSSSLQYLHNQSHTQSQNQLHNQDHHGQVVDSQSGSVNEHDHKKHSGCDGTDHCNHCVNLLSSVNSNSVSTFKSSPIIGLFANYYDLNLPSDYRPPRHV